MAVTRPRGGRTAAKRTAANQTRPNQARPKQGAPKRTAARRPSAPDSTDARAAGFVPLSTLKQTPATPDAILAEIRRIYFETSARTVEADLVHAVALLKALPDEDARERATVYMEGLNDLRKEFAPKARRTRKA